VDIFIPSLKTQKRGLSSGYFYPEPRNAKARLIQWDIFIPSLKTQKRGNSNGICYPYKKLTSVSFFACLP